MLHLMKKAAALATGVTIGGCAVYDTPPPRVYVQEQPLYVAPAPVVVVRPAPIVIAPGGYYHHHY